MLVVNNRETDTDMRSCVLYRECWGRSWGIREADSSRETSRRKRTVSATYLCILTAEQRVDIHVC